MAIRKSNRIMMISTHGYVSAEPELGKPDTGGQVVYVLEISKCLARLGYKVDILTRRFERQPMQETVNDRVRILRFACGGKNFIPKESLCDSIPEWVRGVVDYVKTKRLGYEFINSHYWDAGLAGMEVANALGIPHVHTPHSIGSWKRANMDGDPAELESQYNFRRRIRDEKAIYDECDLMVATTWQQRDILRGEDYDVPNDRIRVIPPGYDDTRFFPVSIATRQAIKRDLDLSGRIVFAVGRVAENKGYDLLIRAMKPVFERVEDAKLLLAIGSTDPAPSEQDLVSSLQATASDSGYLDRVLFRDYIPDEQLADYYRAADVFTLSSRYEPFGMTAIEAMACGTPTVITTEGGLWEQLTWGLETIYANPFDPEAFGHAIASVLQHPTITNQLARFGTYKARATFTWNGVGQQILRMLDAMNEDGGYEPAGAWPSTIPTAPHEIA